MSLLKKESKGKHSKVVYNITDFTKEKDTSHVGDNFVVDVSNEKRTTKWSDEKRNEKQKEKHNPHNDKYTSKERINLTSKATSKQK